MSSYWAALSGIVLKLSDEEFEDMLLVYLRKTYKKDATATDVADYQELISDYGERESYFLTATKKNDIINELPESYQIHLDYQMNKLKNFMIVYFHLIDIPMISILVELFIL